MATHLLTHPNQRSATQTDQAPYVDEVIQITKEFWDKGTEGLLRKGLIRRRRAKDGSGHWEYALAEELIPPWIPRESE
jgi:hypothetical protein